MLGPIVVLALVCVTAASQPALAAVRDELLSGYSVTSWHDDAGRPLGSVYAMVQDRDGYLWIGTDAGLLRFDGSRFTTWDRLSTTPVPDSAVRAITIARDGSLWTALANRAGVAQLHNGQIQRHEQGLEGHDAVTDVAEDGRGVMWAIADRALYTLHADRWQRVRLPWKSREGQVQTLYVSRSGQLWVGTRWGVFEHLPDTNGFRRVSEEHTWGLVEDSQRRMWTTDIVSGFRRLGAPAPLRDLPEGAGFRLLHDHQDNLWVGTFGHGLWHVTQNGNDVSIERATLRTGLSSNSIQSILIDRDGNVWAGTTAGLHRLTKRTLMPLEDVGFVLQVQPWGNKRVLAGTTNGLVQLEFRNRRWTQTRLGDEAPDIRSLYRDARGTLWVGASDGLYRFDHDRLVRVMLPSHRDMLVLSISPERHGGVWLGDGEWLYRWNGTTLEPLALPPAFAHLTRLTTIRADTSGRLWMGFDGKAIGRMDIDGSFRLLDTQDGFELQPNQALHSVYQDTAGVIWLGTSHGLYRFAQGVTTVIGRAHGLPGARIWAIVEDRQHHLWLSLDRGLVRIGKNEIDHALQQSRPIRYELYDPLDGLAGAPLGIINAVVDSDDTLWFVRGGGVTRVTPQDLPEPAPALAPIRIEEAVANDHRLNPASDTVLPAGTRLLQISYTALGVGSSDRIRFRYKLEGFDADWVDAGTRRTAFYTNLSPSNYRFVVEGQSEEGTWNTASADWTFRIQPTIYQTKAFFVFLAILALGVIGLLWNVRLRLIRHQFSLVLAERARLSREIHDTLLQSLVGVALQFDGIARTLDPASTAQQQLVRVRRHVEAYIREARQSIRELRSPVLETQDVVTALREFAKDAIRDATIRLTWSTSGLVRREHPNVENQLLRIGQEAITNAIRHGRPNRLHLEIAFAQDSVTLRVTDNGCGFDEAHWRTEANAHYGLTTMRERAEELGGALTIVSAVGRGTSIEARIPTSTTAIQELSVAYD
jgi:signal transduction histidine kinase/streptogramin lyase